MKAAALYHLLLARSRKLSETATGEQAAFLRELSGSLCVAYSRDAYQIAWVWKGKSLSSSLPLESFKFYTRGDTGRPVGGASGNENLRLRNWSSAGTAISSLATASGLYWIPDSRNELLGLTPASTGVHAIDQLSIVLLSIAVLVVSSLWGDWHVVAWSGISVWSVGTLWSLQDDVHLRKPIMYIEAGVVALLSLLPRFFGAELAPAAALSAALAVLCLAESRSEKNGSIVWGVSGAMWVLASWFGGLAATITGFVSIAVVGSAYFFLRGRIRGVSAGLYALSTLAALLFGLWRASSSSEAGAVVYNGSLFVACLVPVLSASVWCTSWILGQRRRLMPWFSFLLISIAATVICFTNSSSLLSYGVFLGLVVSASLRVIKAFLDSTASRVL